MLECFLCHMHAHLSPGLIVTLSQYTPSLSESFLLFVVEMIFSKHLFTIYEENFFFSCFFVYYGKFTFTERHSKRFDGRVNAEIIIC